MFHGNDVMKYQGRLGFDSLNCSFIDEKTLADELKKLKSEDIQRYIQQFERAKQNAKRTYLLRQQQLNEDNDFIKSFQKKYNKTK